MKKIFTLLLLTLLPIMASAEIVEIGGIYYDLDTRNGASVSSSPNKYSGELVIPESVTYGYVTYSVTSIGWSAFSDCTGLNSIIIPNSVTSIGMNAFLNCTGLTTINIPPSVTSIGRNAFINTGWYNYHDDGILYLDDWLIGFKGDVNGDYTMPTNIKGMASYALSGCKVTSVTINNIINTIPEGAFCGSLAKTLTIGRNVKWIREAALVCNLNDIYCLPKDVPEAVDAFDGVDLYQSVRDMILHVPVSSVETYRATDPWKGFKEIVALEEDSTEDLIKITSAGQTTWCSAFDLDFTGVEGLKAYIAAGYNRTTGTIWLMRINEVPASEGILLIGDTGDYQIPHKSTTTYYKNLLVGTLTDKIINEIDGEYTNYYLSNGAYGVGFYKVNGSVDLEANRAFLPLLKNTTSSSRNFIGIEFGEGSECTTGISALNDNGEMINKDVWYNLHGQRVDNPGKGIYIHNGRKVVIK